MRVLVRTFKAIQIHCKNVSGYNQYKTAPLPPRATLPNTLSPTTSHHNASWRNYHLDLRKLAVVVSREQKSAVPELGSPLA